ncbi:Acid stress-induced BolA-like protein IbaG/YrbA, predicted regulator of iron metabolism [Marinobacter gudaonensis]|jgi:acid stress-induced BolA-like protein IbaG/YrbA|uniref:Acid stress-induced BolA-like protein IbaG/YrbA, predicted regulator of iron metabolism n=1 Tax=Marinobacter gudaonensis TaxID=375760 RepID=A0A1I6GJT2_9GAMM|nr:BolA/IbaG family iron-sulfur metabolism protein [Marinobacter gudaonensis]SFR42464.1 Acid stress-induced BolA-like protein IbaG/YrbA, predicted regulator of iron metabolism [Marinobacter gudaonensis]
MDANQVTELVKESFPDCDVQVQVDGTHYLVVVVGDVFEGLSTIKRQQLINKALFQQVMDGTIHALHPRAFTPAEWADRQG